MRRPVPQPPALDVLARFARLGVTSFGGPVAHLGYFRREFVDRAKWLDDASFGELVALCSALPGPTSSQVGMALGAKRAGPLGALLAWLAFTTPSALVLTAFGLALRHADESGFVAATASGHATLAQRALAGALLGLGGAAAGVVLLAVLNLARSLTKTAPTRAIAAGAFVAALAIDRLAPQFQWIPLVGGGIAGALVLRGGTLPAGKALVHVPRRIGFAAGLSLIALLIALPLVAVPGSALDLFATFFRAGSLVFGGGHVVLPFLQSAIAENVVPTREFFAGYGAAQSVPGPLFTFASFVGAVAHVPAGGVLGAIACTLGIFAPSFLLLAAAIPLWTALRDVPRAPATLGGINAAVVGMLAAVFVDPIGTSIVVAPLALVIAVVAFVAFWKFDAPPWLVVSMSAAVGAGVAVAVTFMSR
jgi:chromate transporter